MNAQHSTSNQLKQMGRERAYCTVISTFAMPLTAHLKLPPNRESARACGRRASFLTTDYTENTDWGWLRALGLLRLTESRSALNTNPHASGRFSQLIEGYLGKVGAFLGELPQSRDGEISPPAENMDGACSNPGASLVAVGPAPEGLGLDLQLAAQFPNGVVLNQRRFRILFNPRNQNREGVGPKVRDRGAHQSIHLINSPDVSIGRVASLEGVIVCGLKLLLVGIGSQVYGQKQGGRNQRREGDFAPATYHSKNPSSGSHHE